MRARSLVSRATHVDPGTESALELVIATGRAYQAIVDGVRQQLADAGLGMTAFAVLEVLYHKGPLPLGEIRDRILVTGASTTYVVKKLEKRGLLRRTPSAEDQRVVIGELTPEGTELIGTLFPAHAERLLQITGGLSIAEKRATTQALRKIAHWADAQGPAPAGAATRTG